MKTRTTQRGVVVPVLKNLETPVGIYRIWSSNVPNTHYVGSTVNLQKRANDHWRDVQKDAKACNLKPLFNAGFDAVVFEVLEHLPATTKKFDSALLLAEERWARHFSEDGVLLSNLCGYVWTDAERTKRRSERSSTLLQDEKHVSGMLRHHQRQVAFYQAALDALLP